MPSLATRQLNENKERKKAYAANARAYLVAVREFTGPYQEICTSQGIPSIIVRNRKDDHAWERAKTRGLSATTLASVTSHLLKQHYCELLYLFETNSSKYLMNSPLGLRVIDSHTKVILFFAVNKVGNGDSYMLTLQTCMTTSYKMLVEKPLEYEFRINTND